MNEKIKQYFSGNPVELQGFPRFAICQNYMK